MVMAESEETTMNKRASMDSVSSHGASEPHQAACRRLTVWCKSLVFRVDNYGVGQGSDMELMDHAGRVLLTVRRRQRKVSIDLFHYLSFLAIMHDLNPFENWPHACQRKMLSLMPETWEVYSGDVDEKAMEAHLMMRATKDLCSSSCTVSVPAVDKPGIYRLSWSRREEWSRIYRCCSTGDDTLVAEVRRKLGGPEKATLLGKDVLSLVVQPGMDHAITMAMLMIANSYR